jgi:hypothetical protein
MWMPALAHFSYSLESCRDDPLFMCQIISSAIVNAPPPHPVTKMLMRTNFAGATCSSSCSSHITASCLHSIRCIAGPQHTHAWRSASAAVGCGQLLLCTLANFTELLALHHIVAANVDHRTREKLVRAFYPLHPRTDKLIAQRNW